MSKPKAINKGDDLGPTAEWKIAIDYTKALIADHQEAIDSLKETLSIFESLRKGGRPFSRSGWRRIAHSAVPGK